MKITSLLCWFINTEISAMTSATTLCTKQWCAMQWWVNPNFGLKPNLSHFVSVFGLSERLIQKCNDPVIASSTVVIGVHCRYWLGTSYWKSAGHEMLGNCVVPGRRVVILLDTFVEASLTLTTRYVTDDLFVTVSLTNCVKNTTGDYIRRFI